MEVLQDTRHTVHDVGVRVLLILLLISVDQSTVAPAFFMDLASAMRKASGRERLGRVLQHVRKRRKARLLATRARLRRDSCGSEEEEDAVRALHLLACATPAIDVPAILLDVRDTEEVEDEERAATLLGQRA